MSATRSRSDRVHNTFRIIDEVRDYLALMACDQKRVGNEFLAGHLNACCTDLHEATKTLRDAESEAISESLHNAQQASTNVLKAALAGMGLLGEDE